MKFSIQILSFAVFLLCLPANVSAQKKQFAKISASMQSAVDNGDLRGLYYYVDMSGYIGKGAISVKAFDKYFADGKYALRGVNKERINAVENPFNKLRVDKEVIVYFEFREKEELRRQREINKKKKEDALAAEKEEQRLFREKLMRNRGVNIERALAAKADAETKAEEGHINVAIDSLVSSKKIFDLYLELDTEEQFEFSIVLNLLGSLYSKTGKLRYAGTLLEKAVDIRRNLAVNEPSYTFFVGESEMNLANVKLAESKYATATKILKSAVANFEQSERGALYLAEGYNILGLSSQYSKSYEQANAYYATAREKYMMLADKDQALPLAILDRRLGTVAYFTKDYTTAKTYMESSVADLRELSYSTPGFSYESELVRSLMLLGEIQITKLDQREEGVLVLRESYELGKVYYGQGDGQFDAYINQIQKLRRKYGF